MLTEDDLALLEAIHSTGSLSRAAAKLGKAPSTVSHAARQLESRFDALLFDRRRYRLQLTPAGELLTRESARIRDDVARMTRRVRQVAGGWEDRLSIVMDELLEFETLLPVIRDFDDLKSGVQLRFGHEVLGGVWEALREGRADLVVGATNEPPPIPKLKWLEIGAMEWVFAVSPRHPLAKAPKPVKPDLLAQHRSVVVGDTARGRGKAYGVLGGQATLAVPTMRAKLLAQRDGLGAGWVPLERARGFLKRGELVRLEPAQPREPNVLYVAWRGDAEGRALQWWVSRLSDQRLTRKLVAGIAA